MYKKSKKKTVLLTSEHHNRQPHSADSNFCLHLLLFRPYLQKPYEI